MIYRITPTLSKLLGIKPISESKARTFSPWSEWVCDSTLVNMDLGYPSDRIILAVNTKTLLSVFFPFDALAEYDDITQALFFFFYWAISEQSGQKQIDFSAIISPDILNIHFSKLTEKKEMDLLRDFARAINHYTKVGQKKTKHGPFVVTLPTMIRKLNLLPRKELNQKSPWVLSLELLSSVNLQNGKGWQERNPQNFQFNA